MGGLCFKGIGIGSGDFFKGKPGEGIGYIAVGLCDSATVKAAGYAGQVFSEFGAVMAFGLAVWAIAGVAFKRPTRKALEASNHVGRVFAHVRGHALDQSDNVTPMRPEEGNGVAGIGKARETGISAAAGNVFKVGAGIVTATELAKDGANEALWDAAAFTEGGDCGLCGCAHVVVDVVPAALGAARRVLCGRCDWTALTKAKKLAWPAVI